MQRSTLSNCRVVLVRTQFAGNLGSTARAMLNFGVRELLLVNPEADVHDSQARAMATHGESILDSARIVEALDEALIGCGLVAATSAREGGIFRRQTVVRPEEAAARLVEAMASGPVAVVFGPERTGLTDEEVTRCHLQIRIPTSAEYPALNLAQAVTICLYELHRVASRQEIDQEARPLASYEEQQHAYVRLEQALREVGYLRGVRGEALMHGLRAMLGRARPTPTEIRWLLGLARQLRWFAQQP